MAANSIVIDNGEPVPLEEEKFFCVDEGVEVAIESGSGYPGAGGCFFGKGKLYISNLRLVFIMERPTPAFHSFSFPFLKIKECNVKKRIFQSKIIQGLVAPIYGAGLVGDASFKFYFPGADLADAFYRILEPKLDESRHVTGTGRVPFEMAAIQTSIPVSVAFASQFSPRSQSHSQLPYARPQPYATVHMQPQTYPPAHLRSTNPTPQSQPSTLPRPSTTHQTTQSSSSEGVCLATIGEQTVTRSIPSETSPETEISPQSTSSHNSSSPGVGASPGSTAANPHVLNGESVSSQERPPDHIYAAIPPRTPTQQFTYHYSHPVFPAVYSRPIVNAFGVNSPAPVSIQPRGFVPSTASDSQQGAAYMDPADQNCFVIPVPKEDDESKKSSASVHTFKTKQPEEQQQDSEKAPLLLDTSSTQDFSTISEVEAIIPELDDDPNLPELSVSVGAFNISDNAPREDSPSSSSSRSSDSERKIGDQEQIGDQEATAVCS